jgi:hypothetical protein
MWWRWVIDFGSPGADRGQGGKYLILPPGYDGPLPEGGFYVARARTTRVLILGRSFMDKNDPKPTVEKIKRACKIYPYEQGAVGTSIAEILTGKYKSGPTTPPPPTLFVEASGKAFNTIPPNDYGFWEMMNDLVQQETPPPEVSAEGKITVNPATGARTLNARTAFFFYATGVTPATIMRLTGIGSQYLSGFVDSKGDYLDGAKTYKVTLPKGIPAEKFWSLTVYDNQSLDTPQRYPRAGSQSYPNDATQWTRITGIAVHFCNTPAKRLSLVFRRKMKHHDKSQPAVLRHIGKKRL